MKNEHFIFELYLNRQLNALFDLPVINELDNSSLQNLKLPKTEPKSPYLVKDIPSYLRLNTKSISGFSSRIVRQYSGFLVSMKGISTVQEYLNAQLSKRNRKNLFSKIKKLENQHNITYQFIFGNVEKDYFNWLFRYFYHMLERRFHQKKMYNRYLKNWSQLKHSVYEKIIGKEASLYAILENQKPIGITLNYHLNNTIFSHIQTYDINFSNYNIGDILMFKHIEWCLDNGVILYDLSMGETPFKKKWCNYSYDFHYQIFYRVHSVKDRFLVHSEMFKLKVKQFLRKKNIIGNTLFSNLLYLMKSKKKEKSYKIRTP